LRYLLAQAEAADARVHHLLRKVEDTGGGVRGADAAGVDVGDQVAVGVSMGRVRFECHVGGEAGRRRQSRPLADQEDDDFRRQEFADVVDDADAAVADDERPPKSPASPCGAFMQ
jgi:hypothetical protein